MISSSNTRHSIPHILTLSNKYSCWFSNYRNIWLQQVILDSKAHQQTERIVELTVSKVYLVDEHNSKYRTTLSTLHTIQTAISNITLPVLRLLIIPNCEPIFASMVNFLLKLIIIISKRNSQVLLTINLYEGVWKSAASISN